MNQGTETDDSANISAEAGNNSGTQTENIENELNTQNNQFSENANSLEGQFKNLTVKNDIQDRDPEIVPFSPIAKMEWNAWLNYFDSVCIDNKRDDFWKIRHIQKYLKDEALTLYINNCLNILHWSEFVEVFTENYSTPGGLTLSDFSSITFKQGEDVTVYYQKKINIARNLGLDRKFILEGLTEGLPLELRKLIAASSPKTTSEWRELVFKLNKLQSLEKQNVVKGEEPFYRNQSQTRPWRPQGSYMPSGSNTQIRPQYRFPQQAPPQRFFQNQQNNPSRFNRPPFSNQPRFTNHYNERLPPSPCWICRDFGIPQAFHWVQNCPFKNQSLSAPQRTNTVESDQGTPIQSPPSNAPTWETQSSNM